MGKRFKDFKNNLKDKFDQVKEATTKEFEKVAEKVEQYSNDKFERTENCFSKLQKAEVKLCFTNGQEIVNYEQIKSISINDINVLEGQFLEYCLVEFKHNDIIPCAEYHVLHPENDQSFTQHLKDEV